MSCAQTEIIKKPKLVINPLALVMRSCNVSKDNLRDSSSKKEFRKRFEKTNEDNLMQRETAESVISINDDEECDISHSVSLENVETLGVNVKEKIEKGNVKVLNFLYKSIIKESITYSLGLIKDFVLDCDSENIVFADKFPFAVVKFLGLLFDAEQSFVGTMLDAANFKIYNELHELVQNKPFRVSCHFESKLRRITFIKNYIASNDYETSSFIKMNLSDGACSLSDAEVNMAPEQSFASHELDKNVDLKLIERPQLTVDLTEEPKLTADNEIVIDVEGGSVEMRSKESKKEDKMKLPPAKKTKRITKKQALRLEKALMEVRTSVLQEGLDTPVQCSIAERMMRNMGWNGGALGMNGTGITEPIKPDINRKTSYGLGHVNAIANPKPRAKTNKGPTEKKPRRENNKRDKRSQKRMEKRLDDLKLRKDMRKRQQEMVSLEKEVEWDVLEGTEERGHKRIEKRLEDPKLRNDIRKRQQETALLEKQAKRDVLGGTEEYTKKRKWEKKDKGKKFQLVILDRLLEFVCDPEEHEIWFDETYNDQKRARIHRLVDYINEGGNKGIPSGWNQEMVDEICDCTISYLVSESFGEGEDRRLSIYKLPMHAIQYVNEDIVMARESGTRCWNHLEVVAGNMLQMMMEFLKDDTKEEIRFVGEFLPKTRKIINNFLRQLKEACDIDETEEPVTEIERLIHDSYRRKPDVTLRITGEILQHCRSNTMSAKIIKVSRNEQERNSNIIVID